MKRIAGLLTVTAAVACALAPGASAYVDTSANISSVRTTDAQFGSPVNSFDIQMGSNPGWGDAIPNGFVHFSGTDANGTHEWQSFGVCFHVDPAGQDATILVDIYSKTNEPDALQGALIHVTDTEAAGSEAGAGDRIDVTQLTTSQYNRQYNLGCADTPVAKRAISAGDITIVKGS
jgi:hypothetical protein